MTTKSYLYRASKTARRVKKNDGIPTESQRLARKENFAIFTLKGRSTAMLSGVVPSDILYQIELYQRLAIDSIKYSQNKRKSLKESK